MSCLLHADVVRSFALQQSAKFQPFFVDDRDPQLNLIDETAQMKCPSAAFVSALSLMIRTPSCCEHIFRKNVSYARNQMKYFQPQNENFAESTRD